MTFANQVKNTLFQDISDMAQISQRFSKHPETDFSRNRKINFQALLHFLISMEAGTIKQELLKYFTLDSSTVPSSSAFCQQRNKLLPEALPFPLPETLRIRIPISHRMEKRPMVIIRFMWLLFSIFCQKDTVIPLFSQSETKMNLGF